MSWNQLIFHRTAILKQKMLAPNYINHQGQVHRLDAILSQPSSFSNWGTWSQQKLLRWRWRLRASCWLITWLDWVLLFLRDGGWSPTGFSVWPFVPAVKLPEGTPGDQGSGPDLGQGACHGVFPSREICKWPGGGKPPSGCDKTIWRLFSSQVFL